MASTVLYPPIVDSYMPAFLSSDSCRVYFSLSKFNGSVDFKRVHATVIKQKTGMSVVKPTDEWKTVIDNTTGKEVNIYIARSSGIILNLYPTEVENEENLYYIDISNNDLDPGWQSGWIYKIQLRLSSEIYDVNSGQGQAAWLNANASKFSEWSTICIVKATDIIDYQIPILDINTKKLVDEDVEERELQMTTLDLSGSFDRKDKTELIHSYCFTLYDENNNIIETSNDIYANQYQDSDSFNYLFKTELVSGQSYKLAFKFETINKYVDGFYKWDDENDDRYSFTCTYFKSDRPPCIIITAENDPYNSFFEDDPPEHYHSEELEDNSPQLIENNQHNTYSEYQKSMTIEKEENEGRVKIKFYSSTSSVWSGNLCVRRSDSRTNFKIWEDIYIYVCKQENINNIKPIYDYTIESGVWYKYAVQTIDRLGERGELEIVGNPVMRNFNYSFLLGKNNQQLKLEFDNTMNNFKYQIYDSKTDAIGAKYPTVVRNGNIYYRTFPINGLISFYMDENELFCNKKVIYKYEDVVDLYNNYNEKNNITQYDYIYERDFRYKVLEFLQDGDVKVFKSPTEGNMIIRLTDINCVPNQTLGRMIYSFSGTAYEVAEANMENYLKYGFYKVGKWATTFEIYETRLGQISMDVPVGSNIFDLIRKQYDTRDMNVGGYIRKINSIHHIKLTFDDIPLRIMNNAGEIVLGNNFSLNGKTFTVYNSGSYYYDTFDPDTGQPIKLRLGVRIYEFDNRLSYSLTDNLIIMGDYQRLVDKVHVTIDFLYDSLVDTYVGKQINTKKNQKGFGQIFEECSPDENIFREIYYRYYTEWPYEFSRLASLSSIDIESNPNSVFGIRDLSDGSLQTHIIGVTGQLQLYEIENIDAIRFLGIRNPETGEIENKNADVLMNYLYVVTKGTYKKET